MISSPVRNPHQFIYSKYLSRRSINVLQLDRMTRRFYEAKARNMIEQGCRLTNHIAVASRILKKSQRAKYKDRRFVEGRRVFYIFPCEAIPFDVFAIVEPVDGTFVYGADYEEG